MPTVRTGFGLTQQIWNSQQIRERDLHQEPASKLRSIRNLSLSCRNRGNSTFVHVFEPEDESREQQTAFISSDSCEGTELFQLMNAAPGYRNHQVVMLFSSHHKQIKIDPQTSPKPNRPRCPSSIARAARRCLFPTPTLALSLQGDALGGRRVRMSAVGIHPSSFLSCKTRERMLIFKNPQTEKRLLQME